MLVDEPPATLERDRLYQANRADGGYTNNVTRLWAWRPEVAEAFADLRAQLQQSWLLTDTDRAVLVVATARARRDSYCSLAWRKRLAELAGDGVASQVLTGDVASLDDRVRALASWAERWCVIPASVRNAVTFGRAPASEPSR